MILGFVLTGILTIFANCTLANSYNRDTTTATIHVQYILEDIKSSTSVSQIESRINAGDWNLNYYALNSTPYNFSILPNESISVSVFQSGDPLGVSVQVNWLDRLQRNKNIEFRTLITNIQ